MVSLVPIFVNNEAAVDSFESNTHSFVVKIWLEETDERSEAPTWRGHVTHVPSRNRRYVDDLQGVIDFIAIYIEQLGADVVGQSTGSKDGRSEGNSQAAIDEVNVESTGSKPLRKQLRPRP